MARSALPLDHWDAPPMAWSAKAFMVTCPIVAYIAASSVEPLTRPIAIYAVGAFAIFAVATASRGSVAHVVVPFSFLLLTAWILTSLTWSLNVSYTFITIRTALALAIAIMIVASMYDVDDTVSWYVKSMQFLLILSLLHIVLVPDARYTIGTDGVAWRGGFLHKNVMAGMMAHAVPWFLSFLHGRRRTLSVAGAVLLVAGSQAITGVVGLVAGLSTWWWLRRLRAQTPSGRSLIVAATIPTVLIAILGVWSSLSVLTELVGKDPTLSDRTSIWQGGIDLAAARPWLGYGPGGIFQGPLTEETLRLWRFLGHTASHAHNGVLQVQLDLGLVGVLLILALVTMTVVDAIRLFIVDPELSVCLISSVAAIVTMSFSESFLFGGGWITAWVFMRVIALRAVTQGRGAAVEPANPRVRSAI